MKKIFITLLTASLALFMSQNADAQTALNNKADNIIGEYEAIQNGDGYKVRVTRQADGTYNAQLFWTSDAVDKNGKRKYDEKNPDKSLRNVPTDQIVLIRGLKYNAEKKQWDSAKIYDPQRGLKVNCTASFDPDGRLRLRGKVGPIGETIYWTRIK